MLSTGRQRLVGIGLIVVLGVVIVLGVTTPNPFERSERYWAVFNTAQGLGSIDRDVRIAGVKVGTIGEVERVGDDVRAELVLFEDFGIHEDARVDMRPHTLFEGSNFVDLDPGSPSAPLLEPGAEIPIEQTTNYVTLDEALRVLRPEIRTNLRQLAEAGSKTLRGGSVKGVQRTLRNGPALTRALGPAARSAQGPNRSELSGAIDGIAKTVDAVAAKEAALTPLAQRLNRTMAGLAVDGAAPLQATLGALPGALRELEGSAPALTRVVDRLDRVSGELTPALPDLRRALKDATPVLRRTAPVLRDATPLIRDTRLVADRLGTAGEGGLTKMLELLNRPLPKLTETLEVFNADTRYGVPGYRQLVAGAFTGADATFRSYRTPAQNPNAPGHQFRIGTLFSPSALLPLGELLGGASASRPDTASCARVAEISEAAAEQLEAAGGCD